MQLWPSHLDSLSCYVMLCHDHVSYMSHGRHVYKNERFGGCLAELVTVVAEAGWSSLLLLPMKKMALSHLIRLLPLGALANGLSVHPSEWME